MKKNEDQGDEQVTGKDESANSKVKHHSQDFTSDSKSIEASSSENKTSTTLSIPDCFRILSLYKELMTAIREGPSSCKRCFAIEIDWMRKFQAFGRALL